MRAPGFWTRPPAAPGLAPRLLAPAAAVWTAVTRRRLARGPRQRAGVPVICVGNLTAGGTGKTPLVQALAARLGQDGLSLHVLSRGHGGRLPGPVRVDPARHRADQVGDEPLMLAQAATVWIGRDRVAAARAAVAAGARLLVMDDGFQNPDLAQDLALVVVDAETGFGNGRVIPAGPLREPVADGLARADLVVAVGPPPARARLLADWPMLARRPVIGAEIVPLATGMPWAGLRVLAFAGIGRPDKLFETLRGLGAEVVAAHGLADHAALPVRLLARLEAEARAAGAQLVTTEKDAVRLPAAFRRKVLTVPVRLRLADPEALERALAPVLEAAAGRAR